MRYVNRKQTIKFDPENNPSMTEQCHRDEVKIQNVLRKSQREGIIRHVSQYQGTYMDMMNAPDFFEAQVLIANANSMFETVPAKIREMFDNDPGKFLEFMQNNQNIEQIEELGLDASHLTPPEVVLSDEEQRTLEIQAEVQRQLGNAAESDTGGNSDSE